MVAMFGGTTFNQQLDFDTSSVTSMESMFDSAQVFNQQLDFNTSSVENKYIQHKKHLIIFVFIYWGFNEIEF